MNKVNKFIICALSVVVLVFPFKTYAQNDAPSPFPKTLFGVKLGGIYTLGAGNDGYIEVGSFPVKGAKGLRQWIGPGINYYFEPLKEYEAFKYIEKRIKPDDKFYGTSFRLHLFPIFPKNTSSSLMELTADKYKWEVVTIEWSEDEIKKDGAYYWAVSFCETLQVDLEKQPIIINRQESKHFECLFKEDNKELNANSYGGTKYFKLTYIDSVLKKKSEAVDKTGRKLRMNEIRPY